MTKEEFDIITNKIGCWFTHLTLNSFRKTFDGEIYPSSALGTDYDLFIHKLEKELSFEDKPSLPSDVDEAAEKNFETMEVLEHENIFEETHNRIFIAGAKWMAEQGVTIKTRFTKTKFRGLIAIRSFHKDGEYFKNGEEVIIQIRKKED